MRKNQKELIIIVIQVLVFYLLPFIANLISKDAMVITIFLNMILTFTLSNILSKISKIKKYYIYPIIVGILFIPSMYIYYNEFILIYLILHLLASLIGTIIGKK